MPDRETDRSAGRRPGRRSRPSPGASSANGGLLPIAANGQPGATGYPRRPGQATFAPFVLTVLRAEHGRLIEIAAFEQPSMFAAFGLPASLAA